MLLRLRARSLAACVACVTLVVFGLSGCSSTLGYAAVVDGTVISQSQLNRYLAYTAKNKQFVAAVDQPGGPGPFEGAAGPGSYGKTYVATVLSNLIERALIHQVLVAHKGLPTQDERDSAKTSVSQQQSYFSGFPVAYQNVEINQQAEVNAFIRVESKLFTSEQINNYYQANAGNYATEACVSNILVAEKNPSGQIDLAASQTRAAQIKAMLDAGADFATLAMQDSADTGPNGTAASGGKIPGNATDGCLSNTDLQTLSQNAPEVVRAIVSAKVDVASAPIMTGSGYLLIEVTSRQVAPLNSVISDIDQNLASAALTTLVKNAKVKVNPEFGNFSSTIAASGSVTGVIPPAVPQLGPLNSTASGT